MYRNRAARERDYANRRFIPVAEIKVSEEAKARAAARDRIELIKLAREIGASVEEIANG